MLFKKTMLNLELHESMMYPILIFNMYCYVAQNYPRQFI